MSIRYPDGKTLEVKYDNLGGIKWFQDSTGEYVRGNMIFATDPTPMYSWLQPGRQPWRGSIELDQESGTVSLIDFDNLTRVDTRTCRRRTEVGHVGVNETYFVESDVRQRPVRIVCGSIMHEMRWKSTSTQ
ncbi:MAG: hypothetical protein K2X93_01745 [Candidatus Obscuribacterales bacterium]|nr:hypothetical protein [Candidatus Obscuribacterales bacterium]